jgi:hypothetical protein
MTSIKTLTVKQIISLEQVTLELAKLQHLIIL